MLPKIAYILTCRILGRVAVLVRGGRAAAAEMLVLPHENAVPRPQAGGVRYEPADRPGSPRWHGCCHACAGPRCSPVTPATLLAWHHRLAAKKHGTSGRRRPGHPPVTPGIRRRVLRLARENPLQGYRRIQSELAKPGVTVAPSMVWEILRGVGLDPAPRR